MKRELEENGSRLLRLATDYASELAEEGNARCTVVTLRRGTAGTRPMPGLGDVPRATGVL
jgi:hypothetical protein